MLKKTFAIASTLLILATSAGVNAELVKSDWKAAGDNLIITDTETNTQWLSLYATQDMSINEVIYETIADRAFKGWVLPSLSVVDDFFSRNFNQQRDGFIDLSLSPTLRTVSEQKTAQVELMINDLGLMNSTYLQESRQSYRGMVLSDDSIGHHFYGYIRRSNSITDEFINDTLHFGHRPTSNNDYNHKTTGVFLVKYGEPTVSNVSTSGILATATLPLLVFGFRRKKQIS